ncbi:TetR/AcrR family transcriptional regulator [Actinoallomurus rhizosphaericola]|uniref:TetR/AcrR family transcriptional regulator n=1 Tax=Actinoallomurus rhizosphaericola TaxID=2952536 RepID=UPI0020923294|nr:TetR/AcrR family transcriptional regulator [Actinoallomurus rhizosphaericola]MCO5999167.1 TetR/AcrR family transcriptional regulator [Actinoallomurus rhizosphaericola]
MPQQAENLRVRRTRTLLRTALIELIEDRGFDRLTVGELTERAMVSRAAFYRNYRDKYDLVEQIFDEAIAALIGTMSDEQRPVEERWASFFEHISEYHRLYGALLGKKGSPWFADRMRATLADMAGRHVPEAPASSTRPPAVGLVPTLMAAMFVQAITWWLENDRPLPPRTIADQTARLASALLTEAGSWPASAPMSYTRHV